MVSRQPIDPNRPSDATRRLAASLLVQLGLALPISALTACGTGASGTEEEGGVTTNPSSSSAEDPSTTGETSGQPMTETSESSDATSGDESPSTDTDTETSEGPYFDIGQVPDVFVPDESCAYAEADVGPEVVEAYPDCDPLSGSIVTEICTDLMEGLTCEEQCVEPDGLCIEPSLCGDPWAFWPVVDVCGPIEREGMCCNIVTLEILVPGRPFVVDGRPRLPALIGEPGPALAHHWAALARAELASVASFARFVAQLQAVGAPASLVREAIAAAGDEVRHASSCLALARRFGDSRLELGPTAVASAKSSETPSLASVLRSVILEGCINETLAAHEAARLAELASDPRVRRTLKTIAADEARHAGLAWRFAAWAIASSPDLASLADELLNNALTQPDTPVEASEVGAIEFGWASAQTREGWRRVGLAMLIEPCARALRHAC